MYFVPKIILMHAENTFTSLYITCMLPYVFNCQPIIVSLHIFTFFNGKIYFDQENKSLI